MRKRTIAGIIVVIGLLGLAYIGKTSLSGLSAFVHNAKTFLPKTKE